MSKTVIIVGVVLLFVVGGIFLYLTELGSPENGYSTTPTRWSQAGGFLIE